MMLGLKPSRIHKSLMIWWMQYTWVDREMESLKHIPSCSLWTWTEHCNSITLLMMMRLLINEEFGRFFFFKKICSFCKMMIWLYSMCVTLFMQLLCLCSYWSWPSLTFGKPIIHVSSPPTIGEKYENWKIWGVYDRKWRDRKKQVKRRWKRNCSVKISLLLIFQYTSFTLL